MNERESKANMVNEVPKKISKLMVEETELKIDRLKGIFRTTPAK